MLEGQVDAGGEEGGAHDEATDLDHEAVVVVGVEVELDPSDVACGVVSVCFPSDSGWG